MKTAGQVPSIDIENYINKELALQRRLMRETNPRPLAELQLAQSGSILQSNVKKELVKPEILPDRRRRDVNVKLVAIAPTLGSTGVQPKVELLPPVDEAFKARVSKIEKSQENYIRLFGRVNSMLETLSNRYDGDETDQGFEEAPAAKRARHEESGSSGKSLSAERDLSDGENSLNQYPQCVKLENGGVVYILGPHGTQISAQQFDQVLWSTAPVATRSLLAFVFTSNQLATHTLTGKPSPAFYGRERPTKMQLDPLKVDDIVICVRNRTGGKERHIRATITTKCADTAKKYKRRAKKALKNNIIVLDD